MNVWRSLDGIIEAELTTADPERIFSGLSARNIILEYFHQTDVLTYRFCIDRKNYRKAAALCQKYGDTLRVQKRAGFYWRMKKYTHRPAFFGSILLMILVFWVPTRVLFVSVSGNETVAENQILEAAEYCGVAFGASRKKVRSERVKNALLEKMPQLQWIGVNTSGCHAVISVREKKLPAAEKDSSFPASIVASRDGYLVACTAEKGTLTVAPGQTVRKGQILVSSYTDCGLCVRAEQAQGEIYAQTNRTVSLISPRVHWQKTSTGKTKRKFSLLFRKKRIFLWKDSGIWVGSCGRMYKEYYITLPGGFRLPVALCVETYQPYSVAEIQISQAPAEVAMENFGKEYLTGQMVAGQITGGSTAFTQEAALYRLVGDYTCLEMIGQLRQEEIGDTHG